MNLEEAKKLLIQEGYFVTKITEEIEREGDMCVECDRPCDIDCPANVCLAGIGY